jgi:hypothetical protein
MITFKAIDHHGDDGDKRYTRIEFIGNRDPQRGCFYITNRHDKAVRNYVVELSRRECIELAHTLMAASETNEARFTSANRPSTKAAMD